MNNKLSGKVIISSILVAILIWVLVFVYYGDLFMLMLPAIQPAHYLENGGSRVSGSMFLSTVFAMIPLVAVFLWSKAPIKKTASRFMSVVLILVAMLLGIIAQREILKHRAANPPATDIIDYSNPSQPVPVKMELRDIPIEDVRFEWYALAGLVVGAMISFFAFRERYASAQSNRH